MADNGAELALILEAFLGEHRRCGDLDGGVDDEPGGYVAWMTCDGCGAAMARGAIKEGRQPCGPT